MHFLRPASFGPASFLFSSRKLVIRKLFVVIGFAFDDCAGTIELFDENKANHLVRECHSREGNLFGGAFVYGGGKTVGTADDEHQATCGLLFRDEPSGILG